MVHLWSRRRYTILLAALVALFITMPLATLWDHPLITQGLRSGSFCFVIVSAAFAAIEDTRAKALILTLALATTILGLVDEISVAVSVQVASNLLTISLLGISIVASLQVLLTARRVTYDLLAASLCVYALLVVLWAALYSLLEMLTPAAFDYARTVASSQMRFGSGDASTALYFSLVTITTLGYGDIVPLTTGARALAALETVIGQVYIAILVARLVGLHILNAETAGPK